MEDPADVADATGVAPGDAAPEKMSVAPLSAPTTPPHANVRSAKKMPSAVHAPVKEVPADASKLGTPSSDRSAACGAPPAGESATRAAALPNDGADPPPPHAPTSRASPAERAAAARVSVTLSCVPRAAADSASGARATHVLPFTRNADATSQGDGDGVKPHSMRMRMSAASKGVERRMTAVRSVRLWREESRGVGGGTEKPLGNERLGLHT